MLDQFSLGTIRKGQKSHSEMKKPRCSVVSESPLPDSNRRLLPYHGGLSPSKVVAFQGFPSETASRNCAHFAAFQLAHVPLVFPACFRVRAEPLFD